MKLLPMMSLAACLSTPAWADVVLDVTVDQVRSEGNILVLADLSVHDTAYIYENFCYENGKLYVPDNVQPADLAGSSYDASGVMYQVKILPGHKLSARIVDARQAQLAARGAIDPAPVLTKEELRDAVVKSVYRLFGERFFDSPSCAVQRAEADLAPIHFFGVEDINGFNSISALFDSMK